MFQDTERAGGPVQDLIIAHCTWRGQQLGTISLSPSWTYAESLGHLSRAINKQVLGLAFWDDEGDRLSIEDQKCYEEAFLQHYKWMQESAQTAGPIEVELETENAGRRRNKLGLRVDVARQETAPTLPNFGSQFGTVSASEQALHIIESDIATGDQLGNGAGGTVYKCLHIPTQTTMAMKVIPLDANAQIQKQILAELEILHRCNSLYIIRYFGSFFKENRIMMCTEYMDGGSMEGLGCVPESVIGRVAVSVLRGLSYLQELKIMHRDIKPSNILMDSTGNIKLCDFGVSTQLAQSMTATYVGTNAYMAPERVKGMQYTIRSEVWSVGLTLVELALGRFPYPTDSSLSPRAMAPIDLLQCIVHEHPPRLPTTRFSQNFVDFTARCLVHEAAHRPTPMEMMSHSFITFHDTLMNHKVEFSQWVRNVIEAKEAKRQRQNQEHVTCASPTPGSVAMFHQEPQSPSAPHSLASTPSSNVPVVEFRGASAAEPSPMPGTVPMFF